jgi:hypothetical protein
LRISEFQIILEGRIRRAASRQQVPDHILGELMVVPLGVDQRQGQSLEGAEELDSILTGKLGGVQGLDLVFLFTEEGVVCL